MPDTKILFCINSMPPRNYTESKQIQSDLHKIGFTDSRASMSAGWIWSNQFHEQQTLMYWVNQYLENTFDYDVFLQNEVGMYPYHEDKQDEWVPVNVPTEGRVPEGDEENVPDEWSVPIINTTPDNVKALTQDGIAYMQDETPPTLLFHGTDHKSAQHVVLNGIQLNKGKPKQDFSDGDGFYLTPVYEYAVDWAMKQTAGAVLVFKVSTAVRDRFRGITLFESKEDWSNVVKYNRSGRDTNKFKMPKDLKKEFRKCDYVQGAMSGDGNKFTGPNFKPSGFDRTDRKQMCILSGKMAEVFGDIRNIDSVIFVNSPVIPCRAEHGYIRVAPEHE